MKRGGAGPVKLVAWESQGLHLPAGPRFFLNSLSHQVPEPVGICPRGENFVSGCAALFSGLQTGHRGKGRRWSPLYRVGEEKGHEPWSGGSRLGSEERKGVERE